VSSLSTEKRFLTAGKKMKLIYIAKIIIFFTIPITLYACAEKNWPGLSPLSEFENNFFVD